MTETLSESSLDVELRVGPWEVQPSLNRIRSADEQRRLEPKLIELLCFFAANPRRVLSKQELIDAVWEGQFLSDSALTRSISELRRALGDDVQAPRFIETIAKRGYRLVAEVERLEVAKRTAHRSNADRPARAWSAGWPSWMAFAVLLVVAGVFIGLRLWRPTSTDYTQLSPPAAEDLGVGLAQLTTSPGLEAFPSYSPDGDRLAYSVDSSGSFEIVVRQIAAGSPELQLTDDGQQNVQARWSPDGRQIVYHSLGRGGIWVLPALGGEARRLTSFGSWPSWSPDGKALVFQSQPGFELGLNSYPATPPATLWTVPSAGGDPQHLTWAGWPPGGHGGAAWSPDGARIAFVASDFGGSVIWTVRPDGKDARPLRVPGVPREVAWSASSAAVFFTTRSRGEHWLWRAPLSSLTGEPTGAPEQLARAPMRLGTLNRGGTRMVATRVEQSSRLWSFPLDPETGRPSGPPRQLTFGTQLRDTRPALSPDGLRIVFTQSRIGQRSQLFVMNADGSDLAPLTLDEELSTWSPTWSDDGRSVLFTAYASDGPWLRRIDVETRETTRLLKIRPGWRASQPSPDGTRLAFYETPRKAPATVFVHSLVDGRTLRIGTDEDFVGFPVWSRDGRSLAVELASPYGYQVGILPAAGGALRRLTDEPGEHWPGGFSPDGRRVVLAASRNGVWGLRWIELEDGTQVEITDGSNDLGLYYRYPTWSPTGDQIVAERAVIDLDLWEVIFE